MEFQIILKTSRKIVIELLNQGIYYTESSYSIYIDDTFLMESNKIIQTISDLKPDKEYRISIKSDVRVSEEIIFQTESEFVTLDVKKFGAKGDGIKDDTLSIQTAIQCCPADGRVLIPEGIYKVTTLFLKDNLYLEISDKAVLSACTEREKFPVLPGLIESYDESSEYNVGTWEGNPLDMFASIITGINVSNVVISGGGLIEGNASFENWWANTRKKDIAYRPRMIYLNHCDNITVHGIRLQNSPAWTIHPYFSSNLRFIDLEVRNPENSPNTDGMDPESCKNVEIIGIYFSLGDDCIAVKSGKIYMGAKYKQPSENIVIRQCYMRDGHGAVTIGSEMAGGVHNLIVKDCLFFHTDRGLRIKTRRGRGKDAILDGIVFENIKMDHVMTPFVINSFYFCDPDGHTEYVRTKETLPVDDRTPNIKNLAFRNIQATNCHVAAFYMYGLPERKIEKVELSNISVSYATNPKKGVPAMMEGIEPMSRMGLYANNINTLEISNVIIEGQDGEAFTIENVDHLEVL
jgi:polygalacturonase